MKTPVSFPRLSCVFGAEHQEANAEPNFGQIVYESAAF
jgi:hypothetical protein